MLKTLFFMALLAIPAPKPKAVRPTKPINALVQPVMAADTLVSTVRWALPADDGKGPLDSLKVNINNLLVGGLLTQKFTSPLPTQAIFRQVIPFADATWEIIAQICTFRGNGANAAACVNVTSAPFVYTMAGPPPVANPTVVNAKVP